MKNYKDFKLIEWIKWNFKENNKMDKSYKNKLETFDRYELSEYKEFSSNSFHIGAKTILFPFYCSFWIGLYSVVMDVAFSIDLSEPLKTIISSLFILWCPLIISLAIFGILIDLSNEKKNRKLIDEIIKDRRRK